MSDFVEFLQSVRRLRKDLELESQGDRTVVIEKPDSEMNNVKSCLYREAPHITESGDLIIPFDCDSKYHWWSNGQNMLTTLLELKASEKILDRYVQNWRKQIMNERRN